MNSTENISLLTTLPSCLLKQRVYTGYYEFFKFLNSNYLRILIGPGVLLNTLCLIVLSRPRLSNKSTTIFFLRFLAIFDILAISLKYVRVELNYQSMVKKKDIFIITTAFCKAFYVCMNACISIAMWTIVLMSVDKVVAVIYPLKSSIWLTQKRVSYICYLTSLILLLANLPFISFAKQSTTETEQKYCGLDENKDPLILDIITASILPIVLITAANIIIAVTIHRVSRTSFNWSAKEIKAKTQTSRLSTVKAQRQSTPFRYQSSPNLPPVNDTTQASKRRASAQVTRMLFAVTVSLILFNIPNTAIFLFTKRIDSKGILRGRECIAVSDDEIQLYKISFYSSVTQDILSDLPHIVNFFLYCLAGRKFRSIIRDEVHRFLVEIHLIKDKQRHSMYTSQTSKSDIVNTVTSNRNPQRVPSRNSLLPSNRTVNVFFDGTTGKLISREQNCGRRTNDNLTDDDDQTVRIYSTLH